MLFAPALNENILLLAEFIAIANYEKAYAPSGPKALSCEAYCCKVIPLCFN
jgi:hypothetical protein